MMLPGVIGSRLWVEVTGNGIALCPCGAPFEPLDRVMWCERCDRWLHIDCATHHLARCLQTAMRTALWLEACRTVTDIIAVFCGCKDYRLEALDDVALPPDSYMWAHVRCFHREWARCRERRN